MRKLGWATGRPERNTHAIRMENVRDPTKTRIAPEGQTQSLIFRSRFEYASAVFR